MRCFDQASFISATGVNVCHFPANSNQTFAQSTQLTLRKHWPVKSAVERPDGCEDITHLGNVSLRAFASSPKSIKAPPCLARSQSAYRPSALCQTRPPLALRVQRLPFRAYTGLLRLPSREQASCLAGTRLVSSTLIACNRWVDGLGL